MICSQGFDGGWIKHWGHSLASLPKHIWALHAPGRLLDFHPMRDFPVLHVQHLEGFAGDWLFLKGLQALDTQYFQRGRHVRNASIKTIMAPNPFVEPLWDFGDWGTAGFRRVLNPHIFMQAYTVGGFACVCRSLMSQLLVWHA